jgi:hypothetical protein
MIAALILWLIYVLNALLWTGAVVGALAAIILVIGLCRAAAGDGVLAVDREIDR